MNSDNRPIGRLIKVLSGVSVVIPVFGSVSTLSELASRIDDTMSPLGDYELILVDDGSSNEETWQTIEFLSKGNPRIHGIRLGRNFGQHNALVAGVRQASMALTVTLDDDLQNPPEEIPKLLDTLVEQNLDIVYGVPGRVAQSIPRRLAGRIVRLSLAGGLGVRNAPDVSSFRAFRTEIRDAFANDLGTNVSLDALLSWGSSRFGSVSVSHDPRREGTSNYTLGKLLKFAVDTTTGYSALPLQAASVVGLLMAGFGLVVLVVVLMRPLLSGESVPGFPFLAGSIALFSGAQLMTLGIIGEYLARMHFRIMRKPTYIIRRTTSNDC